MMFYERVVVPCGGIPDGVTLSVARAVAAQLHATASLYSVASAGLVERDEFELQQIAERLGPDVDVVVEVDDGRSMADRLVEVAARAGVLLCLRAHPKSAIGEAVVGGVGARVLRSSTVDVLAIGPSCQSGLQGTKLLIGVDEDAPPSRLERTLALGVALGLVPEVLHVTDDSPVHALTTRSKDPDVAMLAVVTHCRGAFDRLISGSTALEVLQHAECPVLVRGDR